MIHEITDRIYLIKIKNIYSVRNSVKRMRRATNWERQILFICKKATDKILLSQIYKECSKLIKIKTDNLTERYAGTKISI